MSSWSGVQFKQGQGQRYLYVSNLCSQIVHGNIENNEKYPPKGSAKEQVSPDRFSSENFRTYL